MTARPALSGEARSAPQGSTDLVRRVVAAHEVGDRAEVEAVAAEARRSGCWRTVLAAYLEAGGSLQAARQRLPGAVAANEPGRGPIVAGDYGRHLAAVLRRLADAEAARVPAEPLVDVDADTEGPA